MVIYVTSSITKSSLRFVEAFSFGIIFILIIRNVFCKVCKLIVNDYNMGRIINMGL